MSLKATTGHYVYMALEHAGIPGGVIVPLACSRQVANLLNFSGNFSIVYGSMAIAYGIDWQKSPNLPIKQENKPIKYESLPKALNSYKIREISTVYVSIGRSI